jgi:hypothetical protein
MIFVSLLWSAASACHGRDITLGTARVSAGDLSRCGGSACESTPENRGELDESSALPCAMRDGGRLVSVWRHAFWDQNGAAIQLEGCTAIDGCEAWPDSIRLVTTSDGTLWLASVVGVPSTGFSLFRHAAGVWMARYAPDGTLLGAWTADVDLVARGDLLEYFLELTAAGNDVLLGVVKRRALAGATDLEIRSWVQRFDPSGEPAGPPLELEGDYPGRDGPLTIGAAAEEGGFVVGHGTRVARFEAGQRSWVQALSGFPNLLVADSEQGFATLAEVEVEEPTYLAELARYDPRGKPAWLRTTRGMLQASTLAFDVRGDLLRAGILAGDDGDAWAADAAQILHKISKDGDTQWLIALQPLLREDRQVGGASGEPSVIRGADEHIWLVGPRYDHFFPDAVVTEGVFPEYGVLLYEVAPDASYCRAYELSEQANAPRLVTGPDGELYYVGDEGFGRLSKP